MPGHLLCYRFYCTAFNWQCSTLHNVRFIMVASHLIFLWLLQLEFPEQKLNPFPHSQILLLVGQVLESSPCQNLPGFHYHAPCSLPEAQSSSECLENHKVYKLQIHDTSGHHILVSILEINTQNNQMLPRTCLSFSSQTHSLKEIRRTMCSSRGLKRIGDRNVGEEEW